MIELKDVVKYYKTSRGILKTNLTFNDGEVVGLLGSNGAGKTTIMKAVMGYMSYDGEILIDGQTENYSDIAFITEQGSYFENNTANEFANFLIEFYPNFDSVIYGKLMEFFGVSSYKKISKMSTGEKAKVEIAIGFAKGTKHILMDEPFLGKDMFARKDFLKIMAKLLKDEQSVVISTHQVEEIENFVDRVVIIHKGSVVEDIYMDDLRESGTSLVELMKEKTGYNEDNINRIFG